MFHEFWGVLLDILSILKFIIILTWEVSGVKSLKVGLRFRFKFQFGGGRAGGDEEGHSRSFPVFGGFAGAQGHRACGGVGGVCR